MDIYQRCQISVDDDDDNNDTENVFDERHRHRDPAATNISNFDELLQRRIFREAYVIPIGISSSRFSLMFFEFPTRFEINNLLTILYEKLTAELNNCIIQYVLKLKLPEKCVNFSSERIF